MSGKLKIYIHLLLLGFGLAVPLAVGAQNPDLASKVRVLIEKGDEYRSSYRFNQSLDAYKDALQLVENEEYAALDSTFTLEIQDKILMSENGRSMMGFVDIPHVVARQKFSIEDFFLHYPLKDSSWRQVPNQLDSVADHCLVKAAYLEENERTIYWSASDSEGIRNIYTSSVRDSIWSLPSLLNEQLTSAADEIYPMLSPDGKSLFFSSAGLYGVGGYDIYVSRWDDDTNDWSAPVNLGFPYSSPADDFLYIDTEDGHYSMFASNRGCSSDSVWVYVLEFDNVPVRRVVEDSEELANIAQLLPSSGYTGTRQNIQTHSPEIQEYIVQLTGLKELKDSVSYYSTLAAEGKSVDQLSSLRKSLSAAQENLHQIEMKLMMKGIVPDPDMLLDTDSESQETHRKEYTFVKNSFGPAFHMNVEVPEVKFDYSFKVLDVAQYAEDQTIPTGVVYQIQIFATKTKASLKSLKGLSPVFEAKGANGHIVYRVGLFRTYSDVLGHLNTVKKLGFRNAFICAYIDGKTVTVAKARAKEKEQPVVQEFYEVRMTPKGGELDSSVAAGIRQQSGGKDIARAVGNDGVVRYVVGPFASKEKAEDLALFVKAMGVTDVFCGVIKK